MHPAAPPCFRRFVLSLFAAFASCLPLALLAQAPPPPTVLKSNVDEVSVDLVPRDKHGKLIRDLRPDELQVIDDGTAAKITGLRLVTPDQTAAPSNTLRPISLVFDSLASDANSIALRAAQYLLRQGAEKNFYLSVWRLHLRLELVQNLTTDQASLKRAVELGLKPPDAKSRPAPLPSREDPAAVSAQAKPFVAELQAAPAAAARIAREEGVPPFVAGLLALIRQQAAIPGRKTIVYFSDGQTLASVTTSQFQAVIAAANRARVSIYAVDASSVKDAHNYSAGLFTMKGSSAPLGPSPPGATLAPGAAPPTPLVQPTVTALPQAANSISNAQLVMNAQTSGRPGTQYGSPMKQIAGETGGLYMSESENLFDALRRMTDDVGTYYEATYAPGHIEYDGHFRNVQVRLTRPHTLVQARAGYYSFAPGIATDLRPFELAMLKTLAQPARPFPFPIDVRVLRFGPQEDTSRAELLIDVPLSSIAYQNDGNSRLCKLHFSILALIKSADGQIALKLSEDLPLQTALENAEHVRRGAHLFQRSLALVPGKYTADIAVTDQMEHRTTTASVPFEINAPPQGLDLSDLVLVSRLEPLPPDSDPADLLRYRNHRVIPKLRSDNESRSSELPVFFTIYPHPHAAAKPQVEILLKREGVVVAHSTLQLPDSHSGDPIPVVASFSKPSVRPGNYQLWAKVTEDGATREEKLDIAITGRPDAEVADQLPEPAANETPVQVASLIEPQLLSGQHKPSEEEIKRILDAGRQRAIDYKDALPNFSCKLMTRRSVDRSGNSDWKQKDFMTQLLRYVEGNEDYRVLDVNGEGPSAANDLLSTGITSSGEFGQFLEAVFSPKAAAQFTWQGFADVEGSQTDAFKYHVDPRHSLYALSSENQHLTVAYHGFVYIDSNTMTVRRVSIEAEDIPRKFPIHASALSVDYAYFSVGGGQYLLPGSATLYVREGKRHLSKNEKQFRDYRRYAGESTVKFN